MVKKKLACVYHVMCVHSPSVPTLTLCFFFARLWCSFVFFFLPKSLTTGERESGEEIVLFQKKRVSSNLSRPTQ